MKKVCILVLCVCSFRMAYSQDCQDRVDMLQKILNEQRDTAKLLRSKLLSLEKYKSEKKKFDQQLKTKSDSIVLLKKQLSAKDSQMASTRQQGDQKAREEREKGKAEALDNIVNAYKKPFDDLIRSATKESVQRDLALVGKQNAEIGPTLSDLEKYFSAKELLTQKNDPEKVKNVLLQLKAIKQTSNNMLKQLINHLEKYKMYSDALKATIQKINEIDQSEHAGSSENIQQKKLEKILFQISHFVFNYDFNFVDYPYLSDTVLEIMKRKQPNADADIADLLHKL